MCYVRIYALPPIFKFSVSTQIIPEALSSKISSQPSHSFHSGEFVRTMNMSQPYTCWNISSPLCSSNTISFMVEMYLNMKTSWHRWQFFLFVREGNSTINLPCHSWVTWSITSPFYQATGPENWSSLVYSLKKRWKYFTPFLEKTATNMMMASHCLK